jgi:hypothetical protein
MLCGRYAGLLKSCMYTVSKLKVTHYSYSMLSGGVKTSRIVVPRVIFETLALKQLPVPDNHQPN